MKSAIAFFALITLAVAAPAPQVVDIDVTHYNELEARQLGGAISNDFVDGGCRDVIFIWARATAEPGNMGITVGPLLASSLQRQLGAGNVAIQGVPYAALFTTNLAPGGTDPNSSGLMRDLLTDAASQCPDSQLVAGGYSQGAAVTHRSIENLPEDVKSRIAGVVTYGDTQNEQDGGQIPNFPADKVKIFCNPGDLVCKDTLVITPAHLAYLGDAGPGADFLVSQLDR